MRVIRADKINNPIFPRVIETFLVDHKYSELLRKLDIPTGEPHTSSQYRKIFVNAIYLFLKGSWSQDELSDVANELFSGKEEKWDEFGQALYECSELTFYIRNIYDPASPKDDGNFVDFMTTTLKFYEKYFSEVVTEEEPEEEIQQEINDMKEKFNKMFEQD
jgi:hypothetical protein